MGRVADQRQAIGNERSGDLQIERKGLAGTGERDLAEPETEALASSSRKVASSAAMIALPRSLSSVHTMEERLPVRGRMANGPAGRKCCTALP